MALKELIVQYQANVRPVLDALNTIDQKIKSTSSNIQNFGSSIRNLGLELGMAFSAPLGVLAKNALTASADFESLKMKMEVLTGSAEKGAELFEKLVKFASDTPFELNELTNATNIMMGFGIASDDAYSNLKLLGDVAAVVGSDFNRLAITFGQASAEGKLYTKDIRELINNSIPIVGLLAKEMGVSESKIFDLAEEGKISFPILVRALQKATSSGGMFEDGMKKLAKTSKGVWSTFKDNVNIALATFGDEMQKVFNITVKLEQFGNWIKKLTDNFKLLYPETKRNIFLFLGFLTVIPPILIFIGTLVRIVGLLTAGFIALTAPFKMIISLFGSILAISRAFLIVFKANPLTLFLTTTISIIYYWKEIVKLFQKASEYISKFSISDAFSGIKNFMGLTKENSNLITNKNLTIPSPKSNLSNNLNNVSNNLTFNFSSGTSASDIPIIEQAVKKAIFEQNKQSYLQMGVQ